MNSLLKNVTKEDLRVAAGLAKLYLEASAEQIDLTNRIARMRAEQREATWKEAISVASGIGTATDDSYGESVIDALKAAALAAVVHNEEK